MKHSYDIVDLNLHTINFHRNIIGICHGYRKDVNRSLSLRTLSSIHISPFRLANNVMHYIQNMHLFINLTCNDRCIILFFFFFG